MKFLRIIGIIGLVYEFGMNGKFGRKKLVANQKEIKNKAKLDMRMTLILYALIPLICASVILSIVLIGKSSSEMTKWTKDSLIQVIKDTGTAFDTATATNESIVQSYASAPVVKDYLKNPYDTDLFKKAQEFTVDYFKGLEGWEGLYICDWNTKVLTHSTSEAVIGKVLREGDSRKALQDSIIDADGVYNTGILESPSSGKLVMSLYYPILDNGRPIGYVGGATFVNEVAAKISDVSSLNHSSAYIYFVDKEGTMLHHPDPRSEVLLRTLQLRVLFPTWRQVSIPSRIVLHMITRVQINLRHII